MQVVDAATHLEEVEGIVHELFGGGARGEGAVVEIASVEPAEAGGDGGAWVFVFEMQLYEGCEAETKPVGIGLGEGLAERGIEDKTGFEVGPGGRVFDGADAVAQVEFLGTLFHGAEQALQAAAKIGGLADIGLGLQIGSAQQKHGWSDGNSREDFEVTLGSEFQALGQHGIIVSKNPSW